MAKKKRRTKGEQWGKPKVEYKPDTILLAELAEGIKLFAKTRIYAGYLFLLILLILAKPNPLYFIIGTFFIMAGSSRRIMSAGTLVKAAKDGGDELIMTGPYSKSRHPLYFGSFLNAIGFILLAGPLGDLYPATRDLTFLSIPVGLLPWAILPFIPLIPVYRRMISIEEEFLGAKFGPLFSKYKSVVPCFFPHPTFFGRDPNWQYDHERVKANREMKNFTWLMVVYVLFFVKMLYLLLTDLRHVFMM